MKQFIVTDHIKKKQHNASDTDFNSEDSRIYYISANSTTCINLHSDQHIS